MPRYVQMQQGGTYVSQYDPREAQRYTQALEQAAQQNAAANAAISQQISEIANIPTLNPQEVQSRLDNFISSTESIRDKYNGDLALGANEIIQQIGAVKNDPFWNFNRLQLEEKSKTDDIIRALGVNAAVKRDPGNVSFEQFMQDPNSLRGEVVDLRELDESVFKQAKEASTSFGGTYARDVKGLPGYKEYVVREGAKDEAEALNILNNTQVGQDLIDRTIASYGLDPNDPRIRQRAFNSAMEGLIGETKTQLVQDWMLKDALSRKSKEEPLPISTKVNRIISTPKEVENLNKYLQNDDNFTTEGNINLGKKTIGEKLLDIAKGIWDDDLIQELSPAQLEKVRTVTKMRNAFPAVTNELNDKEVLELYQQDLDKYSAFLAGDYKLPGTYYGLDGSDVLSGTSDNPFGPIKAEERTVWVDGKRDVSPSDNQWFNKAELANLTPDSYDQQWLLSYDGPANHATFVNYAEGKRIDVEPTSKVRQLFQPVHDVHKASLGMNPSDNFARVSTDENYNLYVVKHPAVGMKIITIPKTDVERLNINDARITGSKVFNNNTITGNISEDKLINMINFASTYNLFTTEEELHNAKLAQAKTLGLVNPTKSREP